MDRVEAEAIYDAGREVVVEVLLRINYSEPKPPARAPTKSRNARPMCDFDSETPPCLFFKGAHIFGIVETPALVALFAGGIPGTDRDGPWVR